MSNKVDIEKYFHQLRLRCISLQHEIENIQTLSRQKMVHQQKLQKLEQQLIELKKEYLEQEFHQRLDNH